MQARCLASTLLLLLLLLLLLFWLEWREQSGSKSKSGLSRLSLPLAAGPQLRLALLCNVSTAFFQSRHALGVELQIMHPPARHIALAEDRLHRALRNASPAIDALFRVDV